MLTLGLDFTDFDSRMIVPGGCEVLHNNRVCSFNTTNSTVFLDGDVATPNGQETIQSITANSFTLAI